MERMLLRQLPAPKVPRCHSSSHGSPSKLRTPLGHRLYLPAVAGVAAQTLRGKGTRAARRAALLDGNATAVGLDAGKPSDEAPPPGSLSVDELGFLIRNPWARGLKVRSSAVAELQGSVAETWQRLTGPESWIQLQFTECYGLPWPLELQAVQGDLQQELVGDVAIFGQVVRRFRWQVQKAEIREMVGELQLLGSVEGEAGSFEHRLRVSSKGDGCLVESTVEYEPSAPLQTLLNAFGGRKSQQSGHMQVLRRLGGLVDGDQVFDPVAFYDLIGRLIDLVAPFEDIARETLARRAGITTSEVSVLEIGCGSGRWVRGLFDSGVRLPQYLGLDVSSTMAAEAAQAVAQLPNARVVRGDARQEGLLEEACKSFQLAPDRIVASYVLDILDDKDLERLLVPCAALLRKSKGRFAAASICPGSPLMDLWESIWQNAPAVVGGCRPKDISSKLESLGWKVVDTEVTDVLGYRSQVVVAEPPA